MRFAFRKPGLPCVGIAGGNAYAVTKTTHFDRVIKKGGAGPVCFYDRRGERYDYHPDLKLVAPRFPRKIFKKKEIIGAVFACNNMADVEDRIKTKNLSNIRLDQLVLELCVALEKAGL
jgi:hypothetical protein